MKGTLAGSRPRLQPRELRVEQGEKVPRDIRALLRLLPHPYEVGTLGFGARNAPFFFLASLAISRVFALGAGVLF